ncbi:MAG: thymidylate kinase, partial [Pseudomonadota bacterium]
STMAYQGYGYGIGRDLVETVHNVAIGSLQPDLTLILDVPVEAGLGRAGKRDADLDASNRYERMDRDFHERLRHGFLDIATREPDRCAVIDAVQNETTVADAIRNVLAERLGVTVSRASG